LNVCLPPRPVKAAVQVPGYDPGYTGSLVITRGGLAESVKSSAAADLTWGPEDVLAAWARHYV